MQFNLSHFSQSKVDDIQVQENWLLGSKNIIEYRQKLYKCFQGAQERYLERKGERRIVNQRANLSNFQQTEDFHTVDPKIPSMALKKRKVLKESRSSFKRVLERHFVIDNLLITFFKKQGDIDFKKNASLDGAFAFVETINDDIKIAWHDRRCEYRVQIILPSRQTKPIFFYTNELDEAKTMAARIFLSSSQKRAQISEMIRKLSFFEVIFRFRALWHRIFKVYNSRLLKMISFQIMGINLIELANTAWFQREKLLKFWSGQILKREKIPLLRSTFRYGTLKKPTQANIYKSSLMIRELLRRLVNAFKTRRLQRHSAIQQDIYTLLEEEDAGNKCFTFSINYSKGNKTSYKSANLRVEQNKYLSIQNQTDDATADFYEKNPPLKLNLEHISCIATDFNQFDKAQDLYSVRIYGRCIKEVQPPNQLLNLTPYELGLDILRRLPEHLFHIKIIAIEIPIQFASKFSLKADLRVKLRQAKSSEFFEKDQGFFLNSRPYRISVPPDKQKGRIVLKGQDFTFQVDQLSPQNSEETFKLSVVLQRNNVPVTQFMKEFLYEEEFVSKKEFKYEAGENLSVKVSDQKGNKMKVIFSVQKVPNKEGFSPNERDGRRLLIGRYCVHQKKPALIKTANREQVDIQYLQTGDIKQNVIMKRIHLIERSGVNVYNLKMLPPLIQNSQFEWVIELQTRNRRFINRLTSGIQNRQVQISYAKRHFYREQKRDIDGRIMFSVIEVMNIKIFKNCNPYVKITVDGGQNEEIQFKEFTTTVIKNTNTPNWVDEENPSGYIIDLGLFFKEDKRNIKFEVYNRSYAHEVPDSLIGALTMTTDDFINIKNPGQERCLILENDKIEGSYIFLVLQSLFVSTNVTRIEYQLTSDLSIYVSPEQYFHYQYLQKQYELDHFKYAIPLSKYLPNYLERLTAISADKNENLLKSPMLFDMANTPDKNSTPAIAFIKSKLCSIEERLSIALRTQNMQRPDIEEGVLIFKYLWKSRVLTNKQEAFIRLQERFWIKFLLEMKVFSKMNPYNLELKEQVDNDIGNISAFERQNDDRLSFMSNKTNIPNPNQIMGWIKQKATGQNQAVVSDEISNQRASITQTKKFNLMFNKIWENETGQQYADTYYLIQSGIPSSQRVIIWKDLLKIEVLEFEESRIFEKNYPEVYNEELSVYNNYKEMANRQDCLAFRQIDEDIENFKFPKLYMEDELSYNKTVELKEQKRKMRSILKVLVLWSREKKLDNQIVSYSYTKGMMKILQRLITMANEEEAFWLLNGMIRQIPRLFSTDVSCLIGGRISAMRNEMTAFKAILRENLPQICDKLKLLGLPVDYLIYDSMTSFYSHFFTSEVVLRIWDLIIFNMSNADKIAKKRGLWHFMAPAYLILREKREDIMNATSIQQVVDLYNNGCVLTYDPDWIVQELKTLIKDIFVTGAERQSVKKSLGLERFVKNQSVDKAQQMEQMRKNYEADLSLIFNSIEEENQQIGLILEKTIFKGSSQYLDYIRWRTHVMARFKKVAIKKNSEQVKDNLYEYDEPVINKEDMNLSKANLYLHNMENLYGIKTFKMRLLYGKIAEDQSFVSLEERFSEDVHSSLQINQFHSFEYLATYNFIKIEILDSANEDQLSCELIIDLRDLNYNRFIKKTFQMKNEYLIENLESYRYPFTVFTISFFLQTHTLEQHSQLMKERDSQMSNFINSIKRKLPDRIDIFNKKNETEFVKLMKGDFNRIIKEEFEALKCFLPEQQAMITINDNFNYIEGQDYGNISLENLQFLVKSCFFTDWLPYIEPLYKIFIKDQQQPVQEEQVEPEPVNKQEIQVQQNPQDRNSIFSKLKLSMIKSPQNQQESKLNLSVKSVAKKLELDLDKLDDEKKQLPFSLRNFIVSLVLMSHCTINEKLDILYDLFDWNDGTADGLDMNAVFMLIKTIFERNLYYWPSHELFNLVEMAFDMSVSSVYQAFWTKDPRIQVNKRSVKLQTLLNNPHLIDTEEGQSVDVTDEVLETLNSYQRMFGTKIIDFNFDSSAFKNLEVLIKSGKRLLEITNKKIKENDSQNPYKLVIFYQVSSERYMFEVFYDTNGELVKNRELEEKDDLDEYLKRNINKLYLVGRSKGISKQEFLQNTEQIPFLQDLVRVETLYRDRFQSTLQKKRKLQFELVVLLNVEDFLFIFRFQSRVMSNVEGELHKLDKNTFRIMMTQLHEQDVIADVRERIIKAIMRLKDSDPQIKDLVSNEKIRFLQQIQGVREFFRKDETYSNKWRICQEFDRLVVFQSQINPSASHQQEIIMKLDYAKHSNEDAHSNLKEEERDLAGFDCYSLYKHCDLSSEWRLCKIMQKEPLLQVPGGVAGVVATSQEIDINVFKKGAKQFTYWIEFLHHRKAGQKLWLKRRREEILMSARYAREQQRNYEQETLKFIRETYAQVRPERDTMFKGIKKNLNEQFFEK